jgi:hypothetical protein
MSESKREAAQTKAASTTTGVKTTSTLEEAYAAGFLGTVYDPKPNDEYTVQGVTSK